MSSISKNRQLHNKIKKIKGKLGGEERVVDYSKEIKKADVIFVRSILHGWIENIEHYTDDQVKDLIRDRNWYSDSDVLNYVAMRNGLASYTAKLNDEVTTGSMEIHRTNYMRD